MDLWVVAAAAGAGYLAKYWQNIAAEKDNFVKPSHTNKLYSQSKSGNVFQEIRDKTCPLRRLARKRAQDDAILDQNNGSDANLSESDRSNSSNAVAEAATSTGNAFENTGGNENDSVEDVFLENLERENGEIGDFFQLDRRLDRSRKYRVRGFSMRPLNSLESPLDAQQCKGREKMEENTYSLYSLGSLGSPLLLTDEGGLISELSGDGECKQGRMETDPCFRGNDILLQSSSLEESLLENFQKLDVQKKPRKGAGIEQQSGSRKKRSGGQFRSPEFDGMLLFVIGFTVGITSATMASKNELDKLNEQLKDSENLIQDLHDELEMKETLTMKELTDEGGQYHSRSSLSLSTREPIASSSGGEVNNLNGLETGGEVNNLNGLEGNNENKEDPELMSKIEAELEAELERLEFNIKACTTGRLSDIVELDPDFEPYVVQGELKLANNEQQSGTSSSGYETGSSDYCSRPANHAVNPWELSVRLHELIESRLEERIEELETALQNSQNRIQNPGLPTSITRTSPHDEMESSSPQSPTSISLCNMSEVSVALNMSEKSSNKHNGVSVRSIQMEDSDQGNESVNGKLIDAPFDSKNGFLSHHSGSMQEERPLGLVSVMSNTPNNDFKSEDEDDDDASEMLLIKQIVERSRSGSHVVINFDDVQFSDGE